MISVKTKGKENCVIELDGNNLILFAELIAVIDAVSRTIFHDDSKMRETFIKDLPEVILGVAFECTAASMKFTPEQLKKLVEEGDND